MGYRELVEDGTAATPSDESTLDTGLTGADASGEQVVPEVAP